MNKKLLLTSVMVLSLLGTQAQSKLSPNSRMLITRQAATVTDRQQAQAKVDRKGLTTILLQDGCEVTDPMLSQLDIQVVKRLSTMLIAYVPSVLQPRRSALCRRLRTLRP